MKRLLLFLSASCCIGSQASVASDWPHWRGLDRDGRSPERIIEPLPEALEVLWRAQIGIGFSSFSVVDGRVYSMGNSDDVDTIWSLDAETGSVLWSVAYDCELDPLYYEGGPGATPTVHQGSVYTLSKKGHVHRVEAKTGEVIWSRDLLADHDLELPEWSFAGSPFVEDGRVILNAGRGGIALSSETGETLWLPSKETSGYATVVPFQGQHLLFSAKALLSLDPSSGEQAWELPWKSSRDVNAADPLIVGERLVVSSSGGSSMLSVENNQVTEIWQQPDMKWYFNPGVLVGDYIYCLHGTTHRPTELMCLDPENGEIVWTEPGFGSGGLIAAGDVLIVFDLGKLTLVRATPKGYERIHQQPILEGKCWTAPVLAEGRIFCRNAAGDIAAVILPTE